MSDAVKDQFSEDDWFLIATVPTMVGAAMAGAGKSGIIGTAKEAMASMKSLAAGKGDYPDNEIINGILIKAENFSDAKAQAGACLLYTSPSPRDATLSRMPSSA